MNPDDRDVDALLRTAVDPLPPPPGSWDAVRRRARRRRWVKAGLSAAAVVIVAAGAVPAVLAVRAHQDDQQVGIASGPGRGTDPSSHVLPNRLAGLAPTSVSFVSQTHGFLLGASDDASAQLAVTTDGGKTWMPAGTPPVDAYEAGMRFADPNVGFVYGKRYYVTFDGGRSWTREHTPGRIVDLETMAGRVWALVNPRVGGDTVALYGASLADPTLHRVRAVAAASHWVAGGGAIAVFGTSVDVMVGSQRFWSTSDGYRWQQAASPCPAGSDSARVAAWSDRGVVVACGEPTSPGSQSKQVFESTDSGRTWAPTQSRPAAGGQLTTLGAGTAADVIAATTDAGAQLTNDGGAAWQTPATDGIPLGFVGFIDAAHIVALPPPGDTDTGAFLTSDDAGRTWTVTRFPN